VGFEAGSTIHVLDKMEDGEEINKSFMIVHNTIHYKLTLWTDA